MKKALCVLLFSAFFLTLVKGVPLYLLQGNEVVHIGTVKVWKIPYVDLKSVPASLGLKWSFNDGKGVITNGKDFVSFNTHNHEGTFDALYLLSDVASGTQTPWISLKVFSELLGLPFIKEDCSYVGVKEKPSLVLNGALLYMGKFTLFFNENPSSSVVKVKREGMKTVVSVFPVKIAKDYTPVHSSLVEENIGKYGVVYTVYYTHAIKVVTALGSPSLPLQNAKQLNLGNGTIFRTLKMNDKKGIIHVAVLEVSHASAVKIVHANKGVGILLPITSMISSTSVAAVGWSEKTVGFVASNGRVLLAHFENGPLLVWKDGKFDIIETSPTMSVNIGDVPFTLDGINEEEGNVVLYTPIYAAKIPDEDRIYYVVKGGKVVSRSYVPYVKKGEYVLSITKDYSIFLEGVKAGDSFNLFAPSFQEYNGMVQGKMLLVYNSQMVPWLSSENIRDTRHALVVGIKDGKMFVLKIVASQKMSVKEIADLVVNMGMEKAMLLSSDPGIMVVKGKIVEFKERKLLYPVGFGIEIDKTTGGA